MVAMEKLYAIIKAHKKEKEKIKIAVCLSALRSLHSRYYIYALFFVMFV